MYRCKGHRQPRERGIQYRQNACCVAGEQELDGLLDVGINIPAVLDGLDDGGEVVIRQHHTGSVLGHLGAGDAHGHADVRLLQGRGVVDAVAGHGHQIAPLLPGPDDADLVLRGHPGIHADPGYELPQFLIAHGLNDGTLHGLGAGGEDADLLGDGGGGDLVVAGNHDGPDTGGDALTDGRLGLLPGRVHHGDEAQELEVVLILQADGGGGQHPLAEGQHPQALLGQLLVHPLDLRLLLRREASAAQHHVHGPLGQHGQAVRQLVDCAHQLPVGVKGQLRQTGILAPRLRLVEAVALAQAHQGGLCGVSHLSGFVHRGVAA